MPLKLLFNLIILLGFSATAQVVINEIDADTPGTDDKEFVELKSLTPYFPLDGYVLVFFNAGSLAPYGGSASYSALDLDGYTTDFNGIFVVGSPTLSPTPSYIIPNNYIQNGPDVVALYQGNDTDFPIGTTTATASNLIDAVAYSNDAKKPLAMMATLGIASCGNENANNAKETQSIQRKNDGTYEVRTPTPGINNDGSGIIPNYITVTTSQTSYTEGDSFNFVFTTSEPVQGANLIMNFELINGNFTMADFSGGLTVAIPVGQTTTQTAVTIINDGLDEGDEEMKFVLQSSLPVGFVLNTNNFFIRVYDVNFQIANYGTPLSPTYTMVVPTIPTGYYDSLEGLSGPSLKQAVQDIIASSEVRLHSYADIWDIIRTADQNPENSNQVWAMYVEEPMAKLDQQNTTSIVGKWNREHIFCQSRGGFVIPQGDYADGINYWSSTSASSVSDGVSDAHHIRVENGQENSSRNNKNFGNVASSTVYAGRVGSQGSWRGDVARSLFYMAVRFEGLNIVNGDPSEYLPGGPPNISSGNIGDLATLLQWNVTDARDDFEMNRNNYIYTWQKNRNPFIDCPNLADYIFGANYGQPWSATLSSENPSVNSILVYPNPTTDYIIVSGLEGNSKVEIYTITGQLVQETTFDSEIRLNIDLNSGLYLVKVSVNNQSITRKIIVK